MRGRNKDGNIKLLGASSFFNDIGSDMIASLMPFYLASFGGAGIAIGLLAGMREGLSSLFKIFGGWLSDRVGKRKIFVFFGYLISVIFRFLITTASSWQQAVTFVSFERVGKARDAPRDAIIEDSTKKTGRGFGIAQMMDTSGAIVGTILVLFLFWKFNMEIKNIIFIASLIAVLALVPIFFVKESKFRRNRKSLFRSISLMPSKLKYFVIVAGVFSLANFGFYLFLLLRAEQLAGNLLVPVAMYLLFNVFWAGFSIPFGKLSDRIGRKKVLISGYLLFLLVSIGFIFISDIYLFAALFGLYGLVYAMTNANHRAFVADLSDGMKGTEMGFYYFVTGMVTIPAGLIAGVLWNVSPTTMFVYISAIALISLILLVFVKKN